MTRKDDVVSLIESHVAQAGGNKKVGYESVGKQLQDNIKKGKVSASSISLRMLAEACLKEAGREDLNLSSPIEELVEGLASSAFTNITKYVIASELLPPYEYRKEQLSALYTEGVSSQSDKERIGGFTEARGAEYAAPESTTIFTDFHEKYAEIYLDKYRQAISLSREAIYNDRTGQLIDRARDIGVKFSEQFEQYLIQTIEMRPRSMRKWESTSNIQAANFNGTSVTNAIFYSTDHSSYAYLDSQTNKNLITSKLDTDGLNDANKIFPDFTDSRGDKIVVAPKTLLVHTYKAMDAWQLTKSIGQFDTSNNAKNPWGPGGMATFQVVTTPYINTNTHWYLGDFQRQVKVLWWLKPEIMSLGKESFLSFMNDVVMAWRFEAGFGAGMRDYRMIVCSQATS